MKGSALTKCIDPANGIVCLSSTSEIIWCLMLIPSFESLNVCLAFRKTSVLYIFEAPYPQIPFFLFASSLCHK